MQRQQRAGDAERSEQREGMARVFGHDRIGVLERRARACAEIAEVADRRRHDLQPPLHLDHYNDSCAPDRRASSWPEKDRQ